MGSDSLQSRMRRIPGDNDPWPCFPGPVGWWFSVCPLGLEQGASPRGWACRSNGTQCSPGKGLSESSLLPAVI